MNVITYTCQGCGERVSAEGSHSSEVADLKAAIMRDVDPDDRTAQEAFLVSKPTCTNKDRPAEFVRVFPPLTAAEMAWLHRWVREEADWRAKYAEEAALESKPVIVAIPSDIEVGKPGKSRLPPFLDVQIIDGRSKAVIMDFAEEAAKEQG